MVHLLLATDAVTAMRLGGALIDRDDIDLAVVTGGRALLDRLNDAPSFYAMAIVSLGITEPPGEECVRVIRQLHGRLPICLLVPADVPPPDLGDLQVRPRHVFELAGTTQDFVTWVESCIRDLPPPAATGNGQTAS